jgi:hypothetical protein
MKAKIFIPLICYLVFGSIGFSYHAWRHHRINVIYEEAHRGNMPLVVTFFRGRERLPWRIHSLSSEMVGLNPDISWRRRSECFSNGNTISYMEMIPSRPVHYLYQLSFPQDSLHILHQRLVGQRFLFHDRIGATDINIPWRIYGDGENVCIANNLDGDVLKLPLLEKSPLDTPGLGLHVHPRGFNAKYSEESNMLFIANQKEIWRYSIDSDDWLKIFESPQTEPHFILSPDGALLAAVSFTNDATCWIDSFTTDFIDTASGEIIYSLPDINCTDLGTRWALGLNYPEHANAEGESPGPSVISCFDMQNEWERYDLILNEAVAVLPPWNTSYQLLLIEPE